MIKWFLIVNLFLFLVIVASPVRAQVYSTIEVGQATLSAYTTATATTLTPFESITFKAAFPPATTPNVFIMTPEFGANGGGGTGDDPCTIRIDNISNTGFDAVCLEPRNENRDSVSVTFDYIAIEDGTLDIPTTTMGSSVRFHSACETVTTQQWGNNCNNCSGARSFQTVTFPVGTFPAAANIALLTQISSVNNVLAASTAMPPTHPTGEPEFVDVSTTGITSTGFRTAIARMEAGNGTISQSEEICYLAVEDDGCKTLDLSGINGSISTVNFEAIVGGDVVRGHDNPLVVGATFTGACFSSTPVSVSSMRRRDGADGGFIRRASITATNVTLLIDEDAVSNAERSHITEPTSTLAFSSAFTTPVTLSHVNIEQYGKKVVFDWQTSAESFHLGFHLWGETRDGWVQLNRSLIPGHGTNTDALKRYRKRVRLNREQYNEVTRFGISSVDTSGFEEFYGPFDVGHEYGESDTSEPIDWANTRKQFELSMQSKGYTNVHGRWKKLSRRNKQKLERRQDRINAAALDLRFDGPGMHKVTGEDILASRPEWLGMNLDSFAVTLNGLAVERLIVSEDSTLSEDDLVLMNVVEPQQDDALYLKEYTYRLLRDRHSVREAQHYVDGSQEQAEFADVVYIEQELTSDKRYLAAITSGSPWYDAQLFTTSGAVNAHYNASFDHAIELDQPARLKVGLFGSIDLPGAQDDHHVQVSVNGHIVVDDWFDGLTSFTSEIELAPGIVTQEDNEVLVILPGDTGLVADIVLVDEISLLAATKLSEVVARDFAGSSDVAGYVVRSNEGQLNNMSADKGVFAHSSKGGFSTVKSVETDAGLAFAAIPFVGSVNNAAQLRYSVIDINDLPTARSVELAHTVSSSDALTPQVSADLMIVAHPNFIGEELQAYIEFKRDLGLEIQLVDWFDLVSNYGFGNNTPQSLDNYLASLDSQAQPQSILLVGGHTYDYKGVLGQGAVNFIPAHYRRVSIFEYTQSDNVYADLDDDNVPEIAIGRWPVRTVSDLMAIIAKSTRWQEMHESDSVSNDVLLIAQPNDGRNLDFEGSLDGRVSSNLNRPTGIANVERVYLGQLNSDSPVTEAREMISEAINNGTRLVSFAGHASSAAWGFQGIVNTGFIQSLTNEDSPTIVMPLACYTTDYQSLHTNTLAHQWLFAGNQGAAAVHGATSLGQYRENGIFAERMLRESAKPATSLGQAILKAKQKMASVNETLHNWALLGDPTLPAP